MTLVPDGLRNERIDTGGVDPAIAFRYRKEIEEELARCSDRRSLSTEEAIELTKKMVKGLTDDHPEFNRCLCQVIETYFAMRNVVGDGDEDDDM